MDKIKQLKEVTLPQQLFSSMVEAYQKWEQFSDELEDFLLMSNNGFLQELRQAKKDYSSGKARKLSELKKEI